MKKLIIKFSIILIVTKFLTAIIPIILLLIFPDLLTTELPNGGSSSLGIGYLESGVRYFFNIAIAFLVFKEMKSPDLKTTLLFILTLLSSLTGIIFFLFISFEKINNNIKNEKYIAKTFN